MIPWKHLTALTGVLAIQLTVANPLGSQHNPSLLSVETNPSFMAEKLRSGATAHTRRIVIRLYLVRHGETEANVKREVVGQGHSPLTSRGVQQAKALGRIPKWFDNVTFWRIYSSDLARTRHTTQLFLNSLAGKTKEDDAFVPSHSVLQNVRFEARIRELAKGARQGLPKDLSYSEALTARQRRVDSGESSLDPNEPIPLLENEDDGWKRAKEWLHELIAEVVDDSSKMADASHNDDDSTSMYNVLSVGHAGIYRVFLQKLLGQDVLHSHPDARFDPLDGRFEVPNTSLTILDLHVVNTRGHGEDDKGRSESPMMPPYKSEIVLLTSTEHYGLATV